MRAMALRLAGRLVEATTFSESAYALLVPRRSAPGTAVEANSLGLIWLARGRVRTALRFCRESAALLRDGDGVGMLAFALAGVAQAAAQAGEPEAARGALAEMERTPLGHKGFAVELELARAWSAAAGGELSRARALAREAAALAQARGQDAYAVRALHELCRLGDPAAAAPELARLAGQVDGPFAATAAAHAAALVAARRRRPARGRRALRRRGRAARGRRGGRRRSRRPPRRRPAVERPRRRRARRPLADGAARERARRRCSPRRRPPT